ncbi:MAG: cyclopropane-fatty-acyl-phospholipid synthase family protein [Gammaproteobacteria bacterium]|nr:cyclopropane-fatty-acyl-phospholipid synthase family protein [Gammaproteobacteria bacterium]
MGQQEHTKISRGLSRSGTSSLGLQLDDLPVSPRVYAADRWLVKKLLAAIGNPSVAFRLWNGEKIYCCSEDPEKTLEIRNRAALFKLLLDPEFNFGELYCSGDIEVEGDLTDFLVKVYSSIHFKKPTLLSKALNALHRLRVSGNAPGNSRKNIYHHYDIGNEFYQHWLDSAAMQYTCAYFPDPGMSLEAAQTAKMHHVCRKLQLEPGMEVVEAGCGWGGFALFMAEHYGVRVSAYNISHQQILYARDRAKTAGLQDRVDFIEDDFRNIEGQFDRFVSVGMLEHIGIENYRELGEVIDRSLKPEGFGLIHSIGRNKPCLLNAWIEKRIFPGACPPSLGQMMAIFEPFPFSVLDVENLRLHYAKTLEHWLQRFDGNIEVFRKRYDELFVRTWRLYLAGSIAAFLSGTMQLFQVVFARPKNNRLKWNRSWLYTGDHP